MTATVGTAPAELQVNTTPLVRREAGIRPPGVEMSEMPLTSRRRLRPRTAFATMMLVAGGLFTAEAKPAEAATPVRVLHFNICGAICNHGVVDKPGGGNDVVEDVRNRILDFRPAIVTLNEVCAGQFNRLKSLLNGGAWRMSGVFRPQRHDSRCTAGGGFGDAVLTAGAVGRTDVLPLPNGSEHRAVLCLHTSAGGPVLACTLHLVTGRSGKEGPALKRRQLSAAARALNARAARGAVIVGGDFNVTPGEMGALLATGRGGRFFDVDPEAAGTHGRKIDYVLFTRPHFANPSGGPQSSRFSDHKALLGQATRH
jgi:endonuclease/exonuclease/phosphatase family metal-dependent hydrolase